jgi:hypothetical protein
VNIRYKFDPVPDELIQVVESKIDTRLADLGFSIKQRGVVRRLEWKGGVINCEWHRDEAGARVGYNFHLESTNGTELAAWLGRTDEMVAEASRLTNQGLHIETAEGEHAVH